MSTLLQRLVGGKDSLGSPSWEKPQHILDVIAKKNSAASPIRRSLDARYAGLLAFAQSRGADCGRDSDGKFGVGNTCRIGININDSEQDFTGQILSGAKTTETRVTDSLRPYVGKTVGIVRTGKGKATLVGTMKVGEPKFYKSKKEFDKDFEKHRVGEGSSHYIGHEGKYGYPLSEVKKVRPVVLDSKGIVARVVHKSKRDMTVVFDLSGESPEHPKDEEPRSADCGRDDDGKFGGGNKCANADGDPRPSGGRLRHSDGTQTNVARKLYQMGTSEEKLGDLVRGLGGDPKATTVKSNPPNLNVTVKSSKGETLYHADIGYYRVRVYAVAKKVGDEVVENIKQIAKGVFPSKPTSGKKNASVTVSVYGDPEEFGKWKSENAEKQKAMKDKYQFSPYLAPNEKPIEWKSDATLASLLAFAASRNCGNGPGGFQPGNTCASGKLADAAKGAAKGAVSGAAAAAGGLAPYPPYVAKGAAVGAVAGAVKGLYDNKMRPTRVMEKIAEVGSTEKKISSLVKKLGGTPSSSADVSRGKLQLTVRNEAGKKIFHVQIGKEDVVIYPRSATGTLSDKQIARVRQVAKESVPKNVSIEVKSSSKAYIGRLVRNGFKVAADAAGKLIATAVFAPVADTVVGEATYSLKKKR
jgi:hypothetical protein